jgi:hypothetical protein
MGKFMNASLEVDVQEIAMEMNLVGFMTQSHLRRAMQPLLIAVLLSLKPAALRHLPRNPATSFAETNPFSRKT